VARITDLAPDNQQLLQYGKAVFLPIPSDVVELMGLKDGDRLELEVIDSNQLLVVRRK
jgi:antitoxin component of MazEF toxin-antitoxin module